MVSYEVNTYSSVEPVPKSQFFPVLLSWWEKVWYCFPTVIEVSSEKNGWSIPHSFVNSCPD
jgi:hypothetical protein